MCWSYLAMVLLESVNLENQYCCGSQNTEVAGVIVLPTTVLSNNRTCLSLMEKAYFLISSSTAATPSLCGCKTL